MGQIVRQKLKDLVKVDTIEEALELVKKDDKSIYTTPNGDIVTAFGIFKNNNGDLNDLYFKANNLVEALNVLTKRIKYVKNKPLKFTSKVDGYKLGLNKVAGTSPHEVFLYYKIGDDGEWTKLNYLDNETIPMEKDVPVYIKGNNPDYFNNLSAQYLFTCNASEDATEDAYVCVEGDIMSLRGEYIFKPEAGDFRYLFRSTNPYAFTNLDLTNLNLDVEVNDASAAISAFFSEDVALKGYPILPKNIGTNNLMNFYEDVKLPNNAISLVFESTALLGMQNLFKGNSSIEKCYIQVPKLYDRCFKGAFSNCTNLTELTLNFKEVDWTTSIVDNTPFTNILSGVNTTGVLYVPKEFVEESRIVSVLPATWTIAAIE